MHTYLHLKRGGAWPVPPRRCLRRSRAYPSPGRGDGDSGFSTIEAVLVIPVVIVLSMIVVQTVLLWHARSIAQAAASDGLRTARGYQASDAQGAAVANGFLDSVGDRLYTAHATDVTRTATTVTVIVHARVMTVVPFGDFRLTETAAGPIERFTG